MATRKPTSLVPNIFVLALFALGIIAAATALYFGLAGQQRVLSSQVNLSDAHPSPVSLPMALMLDADSQPPTNMLDRADPVSRLFVHMGWLQPLDIAFDGTTIRVVPDSTLPAGISGLMLLLYLAALILLTTIASKRHQSLLRALDEALVETVTSGHRPSISELPELSRCLQERLDAQDTSIRQLEKELAHSQQKAQADPMTGLMNRRSFEIALAKLFSTGEKTAQNGALIIIRASSLKEINQSRGFVQGDDYLKSITRQLRLVIETDPQLQLYRINGSDFAIINPLRIEGKSTRIAEQLKQCFDALRNPYEVSNIAHMGIVGFSTSQQLDQVLASADLALAKAQTETTNGWVELTEQESDAELSQQVWRNSIDEIISKRAIRFVAQPIISINRNTRGYSELYSRFINASGEQLATETVFLMARRLDLIVRLEQLIITEALAYLEKHAEQTLRIGINLSAQTVQNGSFLVWLERTLLRNTKHASRMVFEMPEHDLDINLTASKRIFDMLRRTGSYTAIDKFGRGVAAFRLYKELRPNYIKLNSTLVQQIVGDKENQLFVRMMVDVAHRLGIWTVAEGVETMDQKNALVSLYVDALQGYLIARPQDLLSPTHSGRHHQLRNTANMID